MIELPIEVKNCSDDCKIKHCGGSTTLIAWNPIYDKNGNLINEDPNRMTSFMDCLTCGKRWMCELYRGKTIFNLMSDPKKDTNFKNVLIMGDINDSY